MPYRWAIVPAAKIAGTSIVAEIADARPMSAGLPPSSSRYRPRNVLPAM